MCSFGDGIEGHESRDAIPLDRAITTMSIDFDVVEIDDIAGLIAEAPQPFQGVALHPRRRLAQQTRVVVEGRAESDRRRADLYRQGW